MDEQIKRGDLVQVVRPTFCCGSEVRLGFTFVVEDTRPVGWGTCVRCRKKYQSPDVRNPVNGYWIDARRLKRIPPLSELDDVKHEEEITA